MLGVKGDGVARNGMRGRPPPVETQVRVECMIRLEENLHCGMTVCSVACLEWLQGMVEFSPKLQLQKRIGVYRRLGESL